MKSPHWLSLFACLAFVAMTLSGCATPLPKPQLMIPMPSSQFLLTPPPERVPLKAEPALQIDRGEANR
jgi:hypothetical protein